MELKKALKLLNLTDNYTEAELKNAYRKLIIQYHPDKHEESKKEFAEEKTKEINEAKETLSNYLKNKNITQTPQKKNNHNIDLEKLKSEYLKEVTSEFNEIKKIDQRDKLFKENEFRFLKIILYFINNVTRINNIKALENLYKIYTEDFREALAEYKYEFYKSSGISAWGTHYYNTIKETREGLLAIIIDILQIELNKYTNYSCYKEMYKLLLSITEGYALTCLYGYDNIEKIKANFHSHIIKEIKNYILRKKQLEELKSDKNINPQTIKSLEETILFGDKFYVIYNQINNFTKFKCKIKKLFSAK